jgi:hypothetical protein
MMAKTDAEKIETISLELIRLTGEFCEEHLNEEYRQLAEKLILTMKRRRPVLFLRGRANTWAAAVIYALGQINFLFDRSYEPYVAAAEIPSYFGVSQSTVATKAKLIRDTFDLFPWHPEFSTQRLLDNDPYSGKVMIDGFIVPINMLSPELQEELRKRGME